MSNEQIAEKSAEYKLRVSARKYADECARNARKDPDYNWSNLDIAQMWSEAMEYALANPTLIKEPSFFDTVPNVAQEELDVIANFGPKED